MAEEGHVGNAGAPAADVDHAQPQSTPNSGVGPMPRAECSEAGSDPSAGRAGWAIDDDDWRQAMSSGLHLGEVEALVADCRQRCKQDRESGAGHAWPASAATMRGARSAATRAMAWGPMPAVG